jgi:hypothetical protein
MSKQYRKSDGGLWLGDDTPFAPRRHTNPMCPYYSNRLAAQKDAIQFKDGQILFVDGQIAMDPACCCVDCTLCTTGTLSLSYSITIADLANNNNTCANANGTYVVDYCGVVSPGGYTMCSWIYSFPTPINLYGTTLKAYAIGLFVGHLSGADASGVGVKLLDQLQSGYGYCLGAEYFMFYESISPTIDCDFNGLSLTSHTDDSARCIWTNATCTVSAV